MGKINCDIKKVLEEKGVNSSLVNIAVNIFNEPDETQYLAEEIFKLKEENEILSCEKEEVKKVTLDFISEIKKFLLEISNMNFNEDEFKDKFKNLQVRTKETYKILELMEMLNE